MNIEPAWVTALATVVLVLVTALYVVFSWKIVQQPRKQFEEREKAQLREKVYTPLLRYLGDIVDSFEIYPFAVSSFKIKEIGKEFPYLFALIPEIIIKELKEIENEIEIYQNSIQLVRQKIEKNY